LATTNVLNQLQPITDMFQNKIRMTRFQLPCWWWSRTVVEELWYNRGCSSTVEKKPSKHVTTPTLKLVCELEREMWENEKWSYLGHGARLI